MALDTTSILLPHISKIASYLVIFSSAAIKIPQIYNVMKNCSVEGLSVAAFELELIGYIISLSYCIHKRLPFPAFGEYLFLTTQAIILVGIIYYYSQPVKTSKPWRRALIFCVIALVLLAGQVVPILFEALYAAQNIIFLFGSLHQIWKNYVVSVFQSSYEEN